MNPIHIQLYSSKKIIMRVDIPNPCSENWVEMTPTQRGAFCQTCAVDVVDFSDKNPEEVKKTLRANIGKHMCGRFKESQLSDLSHTYQIWKNQSVKTFRSKFILACMIAFGLTLFTGCENSSAQNLPFNSFNENMSTLLVDDSLQNYSDKIAMDTNNIPKQTIDPTAFIQGDIDYSYIEQEPELIMMGEPEIEMNEIETSSCQTPIIDSTESNTSTKIPEEIVYIKGKIAPPPHFNDYLSDTVKIETLPPVIESESIQALAYPNPSTGLATLQVKTNEPGHYSIELYTLEGNKLRTIYAGKIGRDQQNFDINLSNYPSGTYLVKITSDYVAHALKINKVN